MRFFMTQLLLYDLSLASWSHFHCVVGWWTMDHYCPLPQLVSGPTFSCKHSGIRDWNSNSARFLYSFCFLELYGVGIPTGILSGSEFGIQIQKWPIPILKTGYRIPNYRISIPTRSRRIFLKIYIFCVWNRKFLFLFLFKIFAFLLNSRDFTRDLEMGFRD